MSFSDYKTLAKVQTEFQIKYKESVFLEKCAIPVSTTFMEEFNFNLKHFDVFSSEAARCELIILPILREVYKKFAGQFSLWVQKTITCNEQLNGTPDYLIAKRSPLGKTVLEFPLLIIAEAKKNDFEQGWAQCLAELIAVQKLNNNEKMPIYGIVTDGKYWEFGKLENRVFTKNRESFSVDHLPELMGTLDSIFTIVSHQIN